MSFIVTMRFFVLPTLAWAQAACYPASELKGRDEVVQKFVQLKPDAAESFKRFCADNVSKVSCVSKENVPKEQIKAARLEMIKGHPCGMITSAKKADGSATLYFFDALKK